MSLDIPQAVRDRIQTLRTAITNRQAVYLALRGRYFQGTRTHVTPPTEFADVACDYTQRPHYQQASWADFAPNLPATLPFKLEIHQYTNGQGQRGFVVIICVRRPNGNVWRRAWDSRQNGHHDEDWTQIGNGGDESDG